MTLSSRVDHLCGFCALLLLLLLQPAAGSAQTAESAATEPRRPRIGLVLSGGGARGFAHVGVLKVLRELQVPVDVVTGTSMGSIVGGLFATGYDAGQLEELVHTTDWEGIFNRRPPRDQLDWRRKEDDYKNLSDFEIGVSAGGVALPRGLAGTQRLEFFLRSLAAASNRVDDLGQLPLPFAAIGTDLETGRRVVLQKQVSLSNAMRASMSVPGAFAPVEVNGRLLVDGGVVDNLPVDTARAMGAEIIIAVNVGTPLLKRDQITDVRAVAEQLTLILGQDTIERSIASLKPADILITPNLDGLGSGDFDQSRRILEAGQQAALRVAERLAALGVNAEAYAQTEFDRTRLLRQDRPFRIDEVRVAGTKVTNPAAVQQLTEDLVGKTMTVRELGPTLDRIYSSGDFESVSYSLTEEGSRSIVLITPFEKSWGYNVLRFGGNVQTNFNDDNTFNFLLAHSWRWLNRWGAEWRNEVQIGDTRRLMTEWYQPLGAGSRFFVMPRLESLLQERDLFLPGTNVLIARYENRQMLGAVMLGAEVPRLGSVRFGAGRLRQESVPLIGLPFPPQDYRANAIITRANIDTLDNILFPLRGYYLDIGYRRYDAPIGLLEVTEEMNFETILPMSIGRYTFNVSLRGGTSDSQGLFQLGGLFNLTGTRTGAVAGDRGALARVLFFRNMTDLVDLRAPLYAGLSLEAGDAVDSGASLDVGRFKQAAALFVSVDSIVGPIFFALGRTYKNGTGGSGVYLFWGRPQ